MRPCHANTWQIYLRQVLKAQEEKLTQNKKYERNYSTGSHKQEKYLKKKIKTKENLGKASKFSKREVKDMKIVLQTFAVHKTSKALSSLYFIRSTTCK